MIARSICVASVLLTAVPLHAEPVRGFKICVSSTASPGVHAAAQQVLDAVTVHPLLSVMAQQAQPPSALTTSESLVAATLEERAYSHLVVVGLSDDPLIAPLWQHEARRVSGEAWYVFGHGYVTGTLGYIESDRNPYLHSRKIPRAPFETEVVVLTGSNAAGVALAVDAFLRRFLVNAVVAAPGWTRGKATVLDRDPVGAQHALPSWVPTTAGTATRIGTTAPGEDEYREVLDDTGIKPVTLWRVKYFAPGNWDGAGSDAAIPAFAKGLHRRAYAFTLWMADFSTDAQAEEAAPKIAEKAKATTQEGGWRAAQPEYSWGDAPAEPLLLWRKGSWVFMSTLPEADARVLRAAITAQGP